MHSFPHSIQYYYSITFGDLFFGYRCDSVVSSLWGLNLFNVTSLHTGIVCNGMLHWVADKEDVIKGFFMFDSFNDAEQCHYIDPLIDLSPKDFVSFRVFQGHLWIFQRPCCPSPPSAYYFSVCEL